VAYRGKQRVFVEKKAVLDFCRKRRTGSFVVHPGPDEVVERDRGSFVEVTLSMEYDELNGKTRGVPFKSTIKLDKSSYKE